MKSLFIHIPKTGGMTIRRGIPERIITAHEGNHLSIAYTTALHETMYAAGEHHGNEHARFRDWSTALRAKHPAVAIVRNPWARVVSRYTFAKVTGDPSGQQPFEAFLQERHKYGGRKYYWHRAIRGWYPQKDYVIDQAGELAVACLRCGTNDYIDYFELPRALPRRGVSNRDKLDYRDFYGYEETKIVQDWYAEDIEFFGFSFNGGATKNIWKIE